MTMIDVHRPPPTIGLSDRELEIISLALGLRVADLMNLEEFCRSTGNARDRQRYAAELMELHAVRDKLGFTGEDEE